MTRTAEERHRLDEIWGESWTERRLIRSIVDLVERLQTRLYDLRTQAEAYQRYRLRLERHPQRQSTRQHFSSPFGLFLGLFEQILYGLEFKGALARQDGCADATQWPTVVGDDTLDSCSCDCFADGDKQVLFRLRLPLQREDGRIRVKYILPLAIFLWHLEMLDEAAPVAPWVRFLAEEARDGDCDMVRFATGFAKDLL